MDQQMREINESSGNSETVIAGGNDFAGENGKSNETPPNKALIEDHEAAKTERDDTCSFCSIDIDRDKVVGENQRIAGGNDFAGDKGKSNETLPNKALIEDREAAKTEGGDTCSSCSINIDCDDVVGENQRICRICHLTAKENGKNSVELIELGCRCKGELGLAHSHCAEAWFRVKGNRLCEICGEAARNVTGVCDNGFMEEWNDRSIDSGDSNTLDGNRRCLHGQPLCNLLMSLLVIAFVLPWFFRVNMF